jgi:hypothetical protein
MPPGGLRSISAGAVVAISLLGACATPSRTTDPASALERAQVSGKALAIHTLTGGERQAALTGDAFEQAFASQGIDLARLTVITGVGARINVLALAGPSFAAANWANDYVQALVKSSRPTFAELRDQMLGGKEVVALMAKGGGCTEPCVNKVVVYATGNAAFIIQVDTLERASELLAQLP